MESYYEEVPINKIRLDQSNPRIALILERYGDNVSAEAISLALGSGGPDEANSTTFAGLKESIKTNGGVIHPIILNKIANDNYIVIEGNTRVQIYSEFGKENVPGRWDKIRAIVYTDMSEEMIHAIRLQSHLVGPRAWAAYAKAKYLSYLSSEKKMSYNELISYCGGNKDEVIKMISAYQDMETFYRPVLPDDDAFDQKKFSFFKELQNKGVTTALLDNGYAKNDYAKWVANGNLDLANVGPRKLGQILSNEKAKKEFFKTNASNALRCINGQKSDSISESTFAQISTFLYNKLLNITLAEIKQMISGENKDLDGLYDLKMMLDATLEDIERMGSARD